VVTKESAGTTVAVERGVTRLTAVPGKSCSVRKCRVAEKSGRGREWRGVAARFWLRFELVRYLHNSSTAARERRETRRQPVARSEDDARSSMGFRVRGPDGGADRRGRASGVESFTGCGVCSGEPDRPHD